MTAGEAEVIDKKKMFKKPPVIQVHICNNVTKRRKMLAIRKKKKRLRRQNKELRKKWKTVKFILK